MTAFLNRSGTRTFLWLWFGQSISQFGSALTSFAIGVWLYLETGAATPLALAVLFGNTPAILLSPVAGVVADRYSRKLIMFVSDATQAALTFALFLMVVTGNLHLWGIYLLLALSSAVSSFQWPAEQATVSLLVPEGQLGRANGLQSFGEGTATLAAPVLAGLLVPLIGIEKVILIDLATFLVSSVILVFLAIPSTPAQLEPTTGKLLAKEQLLVGWHFIRAQPGLLGLLLVGSTANLYGYFVTFRLVTPLILSQTNSTAVLGLVTSAFGAGMIVGGLGMAAWGGPRRRVRGVAAAMLLSGLLGQMLFGLVTSPAGWIVAVFLGSLVIPVQGGCANAIWQSRTPNAVQGRVFAVRRFLGQLTAPIGLVMIGPLADKVLQPALADQPLTVLGLSLGGGAGSGYAFAFVLFGLLSVLTSLLYLVIPAIRQLDGERG